MKLWRSISIYGTSGVMLEGCCDELACCLRRMDIADSRLRVAFQFMQRNANTFTMRFTHTFITTNKGCERYRLRCRERRIPSCAMFCAGDLLAILVFVGSRWLMLDELRSTLWMLTFAQSSKLLISDCAMQTPLTRKPSLPLAVSLLVAAPVVLLLRRELSRMVCAGLCSRQRFGESQHAEQPQHMNCRISQLLAA